MQDSEEGAEGLPLPFKQPWDCDITTVARGPDECNALLRRGWKIFDTFGIDEVRIRARPAVQERRQVMVYYVMGRKFSSETEQERAALEVEASDAADSAVAPAPEPEHPGGDTAKSAPAVPEDPKPLIGARPRRRKPSGPAKRGTARARGAAGIATTAGIRG